MEVLLTQVQKDNVQLLLGYSNSSSSIEQRLNAPYKQAVVDRLDAIVAELANNDLLIKDALKLTMAQEARGSKVNYVRLIKNLKLTNSNLLEELANLMDVPLCYNRYSHQQSNSNSTLSLY